MHFIIFSYPTMGKKKQIFSMRYCSRGDCSNTYSKIDVSDFSKRTYITAKHFLNTIVEEKGGSPYQFLYYGLKLGIKQILVERGLVKVNFFQLSFRLLSSHLSVIAVETLFLCLLWLDQFQGRPSPPPPDICRAFVFWFQNCGKCPTMGRLTQMTNLWKK